MKFNFRFLYFGIVLVSLHGNAGKLDIHTHDLVIDKLESVVPSIKGQSSEKSVLERLADLLSDRARLKSMQESEQSCDNCLESRQDRFKAIEYYQSASRIEDQKRDPRWMIQIAHLYDLNGDSPKAEKILRDIIANKKKYAPELIGESHAALGEFLYNKGQFANAKTQFEKSLKFKIKNPHAVKYRLAWCYFNEGKSQLAQSLLYSVLETGGVQDEALKKDFSRDLVTFIARNGVNQNSIERLMAVTPADQRKGNLFYLGQECDRLGNKKGSLLVWGIYSKQNGINSDEQAEMTLRTAQTLLDQNNVSESLKVYERFFKEFQKNRCKAKDVCSDLSSRSRLYVYNWIKKEKASPSRELLKGLEIYNASNEDDVEMINWSGHIARFLKLNTEAAQNYHMAAASSSRLLKSGKTDVANLEKAQVVKILEGALLAEIECAEESKNSEQRIKAYNHYIELNPRGDKIGTVYYQRAYVRYSTKDYSGAATEFHDLVLANKSVSESEKIQAADLSLECLENLNDKQRLIEWSQDYAKLLPSKSNSYLAITRKAMINNAVDLAGQPKTSSGDLKKAYGVLGSVPLAGATREELTTYYKNRITIAERLRDLPEVQKSASALLALRGISASERNFANEKLLWAAETQLDFVSALKIVKRSAPTNMSESDRVLKIAMLRELANQNAKSDYLKFLRISKDIQKNNIVRAKLVRASTQPWKTLAIYKSDLRNSPQIYADAVLDAFNQQPDTTKLNIYINDSKIKYRKSLAPLVQLVDLRNMEIEGRKISQMRIKNTSNKALKSSLAVRIKAIEGFSSKVNIASRKGNFSQQAIGSDILIKELRRFANEIARLPVPRGLNSAQRKTYSALLSQQAKPYLDRAENLLEQTNKLWSQSNFLKHALKVMAQHSKDQNQPLFSELKLIAAHAPDDKAELIHHEIRRSETSVDQKEIIQARSAVKADPFNLRKINYLRKVEDQAGSSTMVAYLDARISAMERGRL